MGSRSAIGMIGSAALALSCGARSGLWAPAARAASSTASTAGTSTGGAGGMGAGGSAGSGGIAGMGGMGSSSMSSGPGGQGGQGGTCAPGSELAYVFDADNNLRRFDPPNKLFTLIGPLDCPTPPNFVPASMAVEPNGTVWVDYIEWDNMRQAKAGALFKTSIDDASCVPAPLSLPSDWRAFGMGFTADEPNKPKESLFLARYFSPVNGLLARVDVAANTFAQVGAFPAPFAGQAAELTGNKKGELYAFFAEATPPSIAQIDPKTAAILSYGAIAAPAANGYAFSYWGGAIYAYVGMPANGSSVIRYHPASKTSELYLPGTGFTIVGAGVAICAPTM